MPPPTSGGGAGASSPGMQRRPVLKIILLGDSGVGKTSLMRQFVSGKFENRYKATIGADFFSIDEEIDGHQVKLQLWDTAGAERFASLGTAFYRGADACVLVYDITNADSFSHLTTWATEFTLQAGRKEMILVGNKSDLDDKRQVFNRAVAQWCKDNPCPTRPDEPMPFLETSAKGNTAVAEAFKRVAAPALKAKISVVDEYYPQSIKRLNATSGSGGSGGNGGSGGDGKKKKDGKCDC